MLTTATRLLREAPNADALRHAAERLAVAADRRDGGVLVAHFADGSALAFDDNHVRVVRPLHCMRRGTPMLEVRRP